MIEIIYKELSAHPTEELRAIWMGNNHDETTDEAFEAIRRILTERLGSELPAQSVTGQAALRYAGIPRMYPPQRSGDEQELSQSMVEIIYKELSQRSTDELQDIWVANDGDETTDEAFEAIRRLLTERLGGELPPQDGQNLAEQSYAHRPELRRQIGAQRKRRLEAEIQAHLDLANCYADEDDLEKALAEYDLILHKSPRQAPVLYARGLILQDLDRFDEAVRAYQQALVFDPENNQILSALEEALLEQASRQGLESLPEGDEPDAPPEPPAPFLDSRSTLIGWPGYRTRPGRTGLDLIDTRAELAHMEGKFIRYLLNGRYQTSSRGLFALLIISSVLAVLLGISITMIGGLAGLIFGGPMVVIGAAVLYNLGLSTSSLDEPDVDEASEDDSKE